MRRAAPVVGTLALVALVGLAAVALLPSGDGGEVPVPAPTATTVPRPEVDPPGVAAGRCGTVTYTPPTASDAHEAELCRPEGTPRAAIVLIHGGGGYGGDRTVLREWGEWYRDQGLVSLNIDYTLLDDGSPQPVYPRPEQDLKAAVQWLRLQAGRLGSEAILVHGSSAGARLGAQAFVTPGDPWFAGDDLWAGVPDDIAGLVGFYGYYDGDTLRAEEYYGGGPRSRDAEVVERWAKADSVSQAGGATGPALLFHGDIDGLITVAQTDRFGAALAAAGVDVTTFIVTDADHAFDGPHGDLSTEEGGQAADEVAAWLDERFP
jgi:acetyl esterase/lipase